ncbi:MAG: hypothetical protein HPZ91_16915 [Lentisphaeria bacterium]|nr:hypothetical protein [Lentisphaeria bacterium]
MLKKIWTHSLVEEHILSRVGKEPLNAYYYATNYPRVYAAAERLFGSWREAITSCGLNYAEIRKYKAWSKSRIQAQIKKMAAANEPLSSLQVQHSDKPLYMAAVHHFKSWGKAVQSAGISYKKVRQRRSMTPDEAKEEILTLFRKGEDLAYPNMRKNHQYLLACGMKKLGNGSWVAARYACGIRINYRLSPARRREEEEGATA